MRQFSAGKNAACRAVLTFQPDFPTRLGARNSPKPRSYETLA